jgi:hypothetical protein
MKSNGASTSTPPIPPGLGALYQMSHPLELQLPRLDHGLQGARHRRGRKCRGIENHAVVPEGRHGERRQPRESFQFAEDSRQENTNAPVGRILQEGVVVLGLHELLFDVLERTVGPHPIAGPLGRAVAQDAAGAGAVRGPGNTVGPEPQRRLDQSCSSLLGIFIHFLPGHACQLGQHIAQAQIDRDAIGLLHLRRILHALGPFGAQLFGRFARVGGRCSRGRSQFTHSTQLESCCPAVWNFENAKSATDIHSYRILRADRRVIETPRNAIGPSSRPTSLCAGRTA